MDVDSPARIAGRYDGHDRQRRHEHEQRARDRRTHPLTGRMHVPLADRSTDAHHELDAASVSLWKAERQPYRHRRGTQHRDRDLRRSAPSGERAEEIEQVDEPRLLEDARAEAKLEYDLAVNGFQRLKVRRAFTRRELKTHPQPFLSRSITFSASGSWDGNGLVTRGRNESVVGVKPAPARGVSGRYARHNYQPQDGLFSEDSNPKSSRLPINPDRTRLSLSVRSPSNEEPTE